MLWIAIGLLGLVVFRSGLLRAVRSNSAVRSRALLGLALMVSSPLGLLFSSIAIGTVVGQHETTALQPLVGVMVPPDTYAAVAPGMDEPALLFHVSGDRHLTRVGLYHLPAHGLTVDSLATGSPRVESITRTTPIDWRIPLLSFPYSVHDRVLHLPRGTLLRIEYTIQ